ncbi:MAG: hypothetical protein PHD20_06290, partial [Clostridia bacterium]|nr:hypothetical protein [Clostridia bacterium]
KRFALFIVLFLFLILISSLINGDGFNRLAYGLGATIAAAFVVNAISRERFIEVYTNVMIFLAVFSLIAYLWFLVFPTGLNIFPVYQSSGKGVVYNLFFAVISTGAERLRNMSLFWEPGAYQTFLFFAMLFEIMVRTPRKWVITVFVVTFITTWSTTGIATCLLLILLYLVRDYRRNLGGKTKFFFAVIVLAVCCIIVYSYLPPRLQYDVFGKIIDFSQGSSALSSGYDSASVRYDSIVYPIKLFIQSPLWGVGYSGLGVISDFAGHTMKTCTPVNWFAIYGLFYGVLNIYAFLCLARSFSPYRLLRVIIFGGILLTLMSEQYVNNPIILLFTFFGYLEPERNVNYIKKIMVSNANSRLRRESRHEKSPV